MLVELDKVREIVNKVCSDWIYIEGSVCCVGKEQEMRKELDKMEAEAFDIKKELAEIKKRQDEHLEGIKRLNGDARGMQARQEAYRDGFKMCHYIMSSLPKEQKAPALFLHWYRNRETLITICHKTFNKEYLDHTSENYEHIKTEPFSE